MTDAPSGIAIVGMAGRFPGARNVTEFWRNLITGQESISTIAGAAPNKPGIYVPRRGLIEKPEWFDAAFFGIPPREAEVMDPQQRIFLEECWTALEDAGCDPARFGGAIGVYAGMSNNTYWRENVLHHPQLIESVGWLTAMMGNEKDYLATRVAYKLNLRGPALNIYTACSTSLVAVCQAVQALLNFNCDLALAGGVSVTFPHERGYFYDEGGILSPDGHCRAFDAKSAGTVFSNGAGVVALKRVEDAIASGDQIYAIIKGAALNNDGSGKVSFTAPSVEGHAAVIALAHALAGIEPRTIGCIEAHGTGTALGDPIEIAGLTEAFRAGTTDTGFCAIGSVKTNIGHLDAAAGIAGLIKAALCVKHGKIPPSLHFTSPNPQLHLAESPFFVADRLLDWPVKDGPRRCGISSFGVGGTNAHCVLEQYVAGNTATETHAPLPGPVILPISAKTEAALTQMAANLADYFEEHPSLTPADAAHTLQTGRAEFAHRMAFVVATREEAISALRGFEPRRTFAAQAGAGGVVFMFPGQGAQYAGMGAALYNTEAAYRDALDECASLLDPHLGLDLRTLLHPAEPERETARARLRETRYTQPAIFSVSYALARLWAAWGIKPAALVGHSVGEYVAATLAGVFTLPDALRLVATRARLVNEQPGGVMLAVRLGADEITGLLDARLSLAAVNAPNLCVVAGAEDAVAQLEARLAADGIAARRLETSHAFHSQMMDPVVPPLAELASIIPRGDPAIPILSTVTAGWLSAREAADPAYWARHARETVRFSPAIAALLEAGHRTFLECGPGQTLCQLARQHRVPGTTMLHSIREDADAPSALRCTAAQLWTHGLTPDWAAIHPGLPRRHVSLPAYPFQRQRYFADAPADGISTPAPLTPGTHTPAATAPEPPVKSQAPVPAKDLTAEILEILTSLSGTDLAAVDPATSFIELGFDSLFLTQAAVALYKRFGVKVTFRQLLQDFPTPGALATHLREKIPAHSTAPAPAPAGPPPAAAPAPRPHGPFRGIDRSGTELTQRQRAHLHDLTARYTARTAGSKSFTAEHRPHFADPRALTGFRREWKEIVYPLVCGHSEGARLRDVDGNDYVDITLGFGQILFGHRPPWLIEAISRQLQAGIEIGPTPPLAGTLAARLAGFLGMERVAFCNTGSEAVAAALRIARTVTGRDRVAVFAGAYHGIFDEVLYRPGPSPIAPGIPQSAVQNLVVLDYGTEQSLEWLRAHAGDLAAVLIEPVQSRHPSLAPREFLHEIRALTRGAGTALIFDEIVTGFRLAPRGAQEFFDVRADIATYGKVIGGGMPVGIIAGAAQYMDALDGGPWNYGDDSFPEAGVTFFAGTFVRHPLALAAVAAVLERIESAGPGLQRELGEKTAALVSRMNSHLARLGVPLAWEQCRSLYHLPLPPEHRFAPLIFHHMRLRGIHAWENRPCFLSTAHTAADIEAVARAFEDAVTELVDAGMLPGGGVIAAASPLEGEGYFPLTEPQREIHLATLLGPDANAAFNDAVCLSIQGPLDHGKMRTALDALIRRHESLRTVFAPEGSGQRVVEAAPAALETADLTVPQSSGGPRSLDAIIRQFTSAPFDIERGPLIRALLVRVADGQHALVLCAHHIACDGWSFGLLASELPALYSGGGDALAPALTMREYAQLQRSKECAPEFHEAESWWLSQFASPPAPLDLPADHPRPLQRTFSAGTVFHDLPADCAAGLRQVASQSRATIFSVLLGGFYVLLQRLTGQDDLVVGIAAAGQAALDAPLAGHCVNFLPLRVKMDDSTPFDGLVRQVNDLVLSAQERQQVTFGRLLRKLAIPREQGRIPLVCVSFNADRAPGALRFGEAVADFMPLEKERHHLELSINLVERDGGWRVFAHFNRDLFDTQTVTRWLGHYVTLLSGIAASPGAPIHQLPLLSAAEAAEMLVEWNDTARGYPRDSGVDELFEDIVAQQPDSPAVTDGDRTLSYGRLNSLANMLAHRLAASGVAPGANVGICLERSAELVTAMLAILKAGCAYVPLDPAWPVERLQFMAKDAQLAAVITRLDHARPFGAAALLLDGPQPPIEPPDSNPAVPTHGATPAYVMYTSGSTGTPKGVVIPHRAIARLVVNTDYVPLTANDVTGHASNPAFDAATFEIWGALLNGGQTVVLSKETMLDPARLAAAISDSGITAMFLTTALFNQFAAIAPGSFARLKHLLVGGEALNPDAIRRVLETAPPQRLLNCYGPTETTTFALTHQITFVPPGAVAIPIGRPITNTTAYILDERARPVPVGVHGELCLGGDGLADGYLARPELTAERFIPHPFEEGARLYRTGDIARWRADGVVEFIGRKDGQVKLRGFRVELGEIENELTRQAGVREAAAAVLGTGAARQLVAWFVADADPAPSPADLSAALRRRLPDYMVPAAFVRMERLPLNANGKLDRRALPAPASVEAGASASPRNPVEERVAGLMAAALGLPGVSLHDDFFRLGGHSLLAMDLLARIRKTFGVEISPAQLFDGPNAAALAEKIAALSPMPASGMEAAPESFEFIVPVQRGGPGVRPLFLVAGGWGGEIEFLVYAPIAQHIGPALPIYGLKARGAGTDAPPHPDVAKMAADYLREIRAIQPAGPYRIAGECVGGICAYEIACQLRDAGQDVEILILLDTSVPNPDELADYLAAEERKAAAEQFTPTLAGRIKHHIGRMSGLNLAGKIRYIFDKQTRTGRTAVEPPARHPRGQAAYPPTLMRHKLRKYPGRVTLLVDEESFRLYGTLGWENAPIGSLETHTLPGDHISYIREHSLSAARKLQELLLKSPTKP